MKISGCILAKNEENLLPNCIESIINFVDEIIVVDNGSTDRTKIIAKNYNCMVIDMPNAKLDNGRNTYLDAARHPWIFVIDADERVTKETGSTIKCAIRNEQNIMGFKLPRFEYLGRGKWATTSICRLFRNHPDIRYNNWNIHSSPIPSIKGVGGVIQNIYAPIHHLDILQKNRTAKKRDEYINLLIEEIRNNSLDTLIHQLYCYLGVEYTSIGLYDEAEMAYIKAMELNDKIIPFSRLYLAQNYLAKGDLYSAKEEAEKVILVNDIIKERALILLAEISIKQGKIEDALKFCINALECNPNMPHNYINIAALLENNHPKKAIEYIKKAIELNPYLLKSIIYKTGEIPNTYLQQSSFLSCTRTIFEHLDICLGNIGDSEQLTYWKSIEHDIMVKMNSEILE